MRLRIMGLAAITIIAGLVLMLAIDIRGTDRLTSSPLSAAQEQTPSSTATSVSAISASNYQVEYYSVDEVKKLLDDHVSLTIVNVDPPDYFEAGHIKGAISLPIEELDDRYKELDPNRLVMLYCA